MAKDIQLSSALAIFDVLGLIDRRSLSFPEPRPYEDRDRDVVVFRGLADGEREIRCAVSGEALEDHFATPGNRLKAFVEHQAAIEGLVRRKYIASQLEVDGTILLRTEDIA